MVKSGFTLLELTIAIFIFSIGLVAISTMFVYFFNSYHFNLNQNITISETKFALNALVYELRETRVSEIGSYPLITTDDQELSFYANVDNDDRIERVRYYINGTTLFRGIIEPDNTDNPYNGVESVSVITQALNNQGQPIFSYYNGQWPTDTINNPLAAEDRLLYTRLIQIELRLNTAPDVQEDLVMSTQVHLRNMKTEY